TPVLARRRRPGHSCHSLPAQRVGPEVLCPVEEKSFSTSSSFHGRRCGLSASPERSDTVDRPHRALAEQSRRTRGTHNVPHLATPSRACWLCPGEPATGGHRLSNLRRQEALRFFHRTKDRTSICSHR